MRRPPFSEWKLQTAQEVVNARKDPVAAANLAYFNGDHWQKSDGWSGPRPLATEAAYQTTMAEIERAFVSRNAIAEVVSRHVNGVLGRALHWKLTVARPLGQVQQVDGQGNVVLGDDGEPVLVDEEPSEAEQALIREAEAALVEWWNRREVEEILQQMTAAALCAKRGVLRLYVPPGLRDEEGNVPAGDMPESLDRIWLQHPGTDEDTLDLMFPGATVYTDKNTQLTIGVFTYKGGESGDEDRAELVYLDDDGNTALRILGQEGDTDVGIVMPLGGRLTLYELTRPALVGEQIVSLQKLLNLALTMKQRNVVLGGFLERVLLNAQLPGHFEEDASGNRHFIPDPLRTGAGTTNALVGITYTDSSGNEQIATPGIVYRDPVPVDTFEATEKSAYLNILQEAQQLHYAIAGDAAASGESRKQARDSFELDLRTTAGKVEAAARWVLETALAMAAYFAGSAGKYDKLRAYVQARVDSGPISADEMRVAREMVDAYLWSREYGMSYTGIEDVDAEMNRIDAEREKDRQATAAFDVAQQAQAIRAQIVTSAGAAENEGVTVA